MHLDWIKKQNEVNKEQEVRNENLSKHTKF
jgi:hypothetical protein